MGFFSDVVKTYARVLGFGCGDEIGGLKKKYRDNCESTINSNILALTFGHLSLIDSKYKGLQVDLSIDALCLFVFDLFHVFEYWKDKEADNAKDNDSYEWRISRKISLKYIRIAIERLDGHIIRTTKIEGEDVVVLSVMPNNLPGAMLNAWAEGMIVAARIMPGFSSRTKKIQNVTYAYYLAKIIQEFGVYTAYEIDRMREENLSIERAFGI